MTNPKYAHIRFTRGIEWKEAYAHFAALMKLAYFDAPGIHVGPGRDSRQERYDTIRECAKKLLGDDVDFEVLT